MAYDNPTTTQYLTKFKGLTISHLNVRSLLRHKDEVFLYLKGSDIICLSETWLTSLVDGTLISQNGYKVIRQDRYAGKRGGGLLLYIIDELAPFVNTMEISFKDTTSEEIWVMVDKPGWKKTILGLIYRPPCGKYDLFKSRLENTLKKLDDEHNLLNIEITILGDLNIDFSKTQSSPRMQLLTILKDYGVRQLINKPTHVTNKSSSIIDLILTNMKKELINDFGVMDVSISDHKPIYVNRKAARHPKSKRVINSRKYTLYNKDIFGNVLLDNLWWREFWHGEKHPDVLWSVMQSIIISGVDRLCPPRKIVIRDEQLPWIDKTLRLKILEKDRAYKHAQRTGYATDWKLFRELKSATRKLFIGKKRAFILSKLNETRDNPKDFWRDMDKNLKVGKSKSQPHVCDRIKNADGCIVTGTDVLASFNEFYVTVGKELAAKFPKVPDMNTSHVDVRKQCAFRFVGKKEVLSIVKQLKNNKSTCIGDINMRVLKDALEMLIIEFTHLMNECLTQCVMPRDWKKGTVSPVPKGRPTLIMGDYRPISVLPAPSKVLERIVYNQLIYYLECNSLLDPRQHGFRREYSTSSAIMEVVDYFFKKADQGHTIHCVYIDYSKAFDTLDHEILCKKLENLGFDRQIVGWCRNYLSERSQCVKISNETSTCLPVTCGVPQGSILGPLFFIIYVNDLLTLFQEGGVKITLYADDTVMYTSDINSEKAASCLEQGLKKLAMWCIKNKLTINVKKTKHMVICPTRRPDICPAVVLNGEKLDTVRKYNYLGVYIDDDLTFESYLNEKCNKVNVRIYQLGRLRKFITSGIACLIYKQTILPVVEYADQMVESGPTEKVRRLQTLQERALRIIDNKEHRGLSTDVLSNLFRLEPLQLRRAEHLACTMYRLSKRICLLEKGRPGIHLRSRNKVKFKKYNRTYEKYLKNPMARGIILWDRIPESVQRSTTKVKFKQGIKQYLADLVRPVPK